MTTTQTQSNSLKILPFNPKSDIYDTFKVDITPEMAQHILDYFNKDNRKISKSQVNKIFRSIENDNWLLDGQPMTFNTDGNLTEFQHRLAAISKCTPDRTFTVIVVVGVQPECFSKTATNKKRNPIDEIQRKYSKAHKDEVSILGDILKRQRKWRLSMQNAISSYENWFKNISNSLKVSGDYENLMDKFSLQRKTVRAYVALCERYGYLEECKTFLELLDNELDEDADSPISTLSTQFLNFWNSTAVDLSNEKRMDVLYSMLCVATDRIIMRDDGMIELNVVSSDLEHVEIERQGVYRKFLA
jgi:hypothetical protein